MKRNDTTPRWFHNAVIYEIYPQSFYDSNGDGIGDLPGIIAKLDYVASLGVNAVWLNPCFASPFQDAGYDVRDYCRVAPRYGTNDDLRNLFSEAKKRGIRVLLDLVPGHTSIQHPWFVASASRAKTPYDDYYCWTRGRRENQGTYRFVSGIAERDVFGELLAGVVDLVAACFGGDEPVEPGVPSAARGHEAVGVEDKGIPVQFEPVFEVARRRPEQIQRDPPVLFPAFHLLGRVKQFVRIRHDPSFRYFSFCQREKRYMAVISFKSPSTELSASCTAVQMMGSTIRKEMNTGTRPRFSHSHTSKIKEETGVALITVRSGDKSISNPFARQQPAASRMPVPTASM